MSLIGMVRKAGFLAVLRFANAGINVVILIILARTIDAAGVGIYAYFVALLTLLLIPFGSGVQTLVLKFAAEATITEDWSQTKGAVVASTGLAAISVCLVIAVLFVLRATGILSVEWLSSGVIFAIAAILLMDSLSAVRSGLLRGLDRPFQAQLPELIVRPVCLLGGLVLAHLIRPEGITVTAVFYVFSIAASLSFFTGLYFARRVLPGGFKTAEPKLKLEWISSASSFAAKGGMAIINHYVDIVLLGVLLASSAEIGIYRVAAQIAIVSGIGYVSINAIATQAFAVLQANGNLRDVQAAAGHSARIAFAASLPLLVIMIVFGEVLVTFVFGHEFSDAAWLAVILLAGQAINSGFGTVASLLTVSDRGWIVTKWFAYGAATNAVFCFALIPVLGTPGAAFASVISALLLNTALWTIAKYELGVDTSVFGR